LTQPTYAIRCAGESNSFPDAHPFLNGAVDRGTVLVLIGDHSVVRPGDHDHLTMLLELGNECLGVHTGEDSGREGSNLIGFSRWRLGTDDPSNLIELVTQPKTLPDAIAAARAVFETAGFQVSVCADRPGRIVDRLIRPQFNLALQALDDGLVSAADLDLCLKLGLGYRRGFIAPLERSGIEHHYDVSLALYEAYARPEFLPARSAAVAKARSLTVVKRKKTDAAIRERGK
jgi:3-hydroxybutyryl-CoA dehydrogenase